mgnify:CR=1 FL=1
MNRPIPMLVCSCDKYSALWPVLELNYKKYLNADDREIYILANLKQAPKFFETINVPDTTNWTKMLERALREIPDDYVITTFDDLFLTSTLPIGLIEEAQSYLKTNEAAYIRLTASPKGTIFNNKQVSEIEVGAAYRTSLVWAIWEKMELLRIIQGEENPWEFEHNSISRSGARKYLTYNESKVPFVNLIVQGKINNSAEKTLSRLGFSTLNINFPVMTSFEDIRWIVKKFVYKLKCEIKFQWKKFRQF